MTANVSQANVKSVLNNLVKSLGESSEESRSAAITKLDSASERMKGLKRKVRLV